MFPAVGDSAGRSRVGARIALGLWIALILLASADVFSFKNTEEILHRIDPEPLAHDQIVGLRALIHLIEYGVLGLLADRALRTPGRGRMAALAALAFALALCLAVAASDESLQAFQPNRSGSPRDVLLNLLGSSLGVATSLLLGRFGQPTPHPHEDR
jgi:VanZ family protein